MAGMIEQHTAWLELCAAGVRGEEYDWRTAELLSCLRAIEWDVQDLEDHVSIIKGNRAKFEIDDARLTTREELIESVRRKIDNVRETVRQAASSEGGHAAVRAKASGTLASMANKAKQLGKAKGFVKLEEDDRPSAGANGCGSGGGLATAAEGGASSGGGAGANGGGVSSSCGLGPPSTEGVGNGGKKAWWLCCC
jgi:vacuolar-type H+-ATPase subunit E/Vma4